MIFVLRFSILCTLSLITKSSPTPTVSTKLSVYLAASLLISPAVYTIKLPISILVHIIWDYTINGINSLTIYYWCWKKNNLVLYCFNLQKNKYNEYNTVDRSYFIKWVIPSNRLRRKKHIDEQKVYISLTSNVLQKGCFVTSLGTVAAVWSRINIY